MYMFSEKMNGNWRKYSLNTGRGLLYLQFMNGLWNLLYSASNTH